METYQYYIDDIQGAVFSPETAEPDFLRDSAAQYAEACAGVNDRLREVARLLHRGLRSEALQLAEEEPNLLDTIASLDFPELPTWTEMLEGWGMAPPPPLLIDLAADINQAYAAQQPLESLLKKHRLFALARAPLAARIHVLRKINEADTSNAAWEADLVTLEKARIQEMTNEAEAAYTGRNFKKLSAMVTELSGNQWLVPTPTSLVSRVDRLHEKLAEKNAQEELIQIEVDLNAAHMDLDINAARKAGRRWEAVSQTAKLNSDDPLAQQATPALEWIADQDRKEDVESKRSAAINALQQALEDDESSEELDRLYQATFLFEEPIPEQLKSRVEQRLEVLALGSRRKHRILLMTVVIALLAVGALVVWVILQQSHNRAVSQTADSLGAFIDEGNYRNARKYFDEVATAAPDIANSPEVQKQKARLDEAIGKEDRRASSFDKNMSRAEQAGPRSPDRVALAEAKNLAVLPTEKARVAELDSSIATDLRERRMKQDELLAEKIRAFREKVKSLESQANDNQDVQEAVLVALRQAIESAKHELPTASSPMKAQLEPILARINVIRKIREARTLERSSRDTITAAVGNVAQFRTALEEYTTTHPGSSVASSMPQLRQESLLWEGVLSWATLSVPVSNDNARDITAEQAASFLKTGRALQSKFGTIPLGENFQKLEPYMQSIANRVSEDGSTPLVETKELLTDPLIRKIWMIEDNKGNRFYCRKKPQTEETNVKFTYVNGFDLSEKKGSMRTSEVKYNDLSPQSIAAQKNVKWIDQIQSNGWEKTFAGIATTLLEQEQLDPILKIVLLKRVLDFGSRGSQPFKEAFAGYQSRLDALDVDLSVAWMTPRNKDALKEHSRAEFFLDSLPALKAIIRATASRLKTHQQQSMDDIRWVGWLHRNVRGDWQMLCSETEIPSGELLVIDQQKDSPQAILHVIGKVKDNRAEFSGVRRDVLIEGRPLFLRKGL